MKKIILAVGLFGLFLLGPTSMLVSAEQASFYTPVDRSEIKQYLPGDFVHIIVDAPADTAAITSFLPNGDQIELAHDRRAKIWVGLWQVPIDFKSGTYSAGLQARDIEGNVFDGKTSPFIIGELVMISLIKKSLTPEAVVKAEPKVAPKAESKAVEGRRMEIEVAQLTVKAKPTPPRPPLKKIKTKAVALRKPRPVAPNKKMVWVEVNKTNELNREKAKLITTTRFYMGKMEFAKVRSQLRALVKISPDNRDYRKMLSRVESVIKIEKERK